MYYRFSILAANIGTQPMNTRLRFGLNSN